MSRPSGERASFVAMRKQLRKRKSTDSRAQVMPARSSDMDRPADSEVARRSLRVAFSYVPVTILMTFMTDLKNEALYISAGVVLLYLVSGIFR